jgi:hypothetical protein
MICFYLGNLSDFPEGFSELPRCTQRPMQPTFYSECLATDQQLEEDPSLGIEPEFAVPEDFASDVDRDFWFIEAQ